MLIFFKKKLFLQNLDRIQNVRLVKFLLSTFLILLSVYSSFILDQFTVKFLILIRFCFELLLCFKCIKYPKYYKDFVFGWSFTSFIIILFTFEFAVVTKLKIQFIENTALMFMICCSIIFLMLAREKKKKKPILIDYLYENTLKANPKKTSLLNFNLALSLLFASASLIYTANLGMILITLIRLF